MGRAADAGSIAGSCGQDRTLIPHEKFGWTPLTPENTAN
jgi:hypothetical protein